MTKLRSSEIVIFLGDPSNGGTEKYDLYEDLHPLFFLRVMNYPYNIAQCYSQQPGYYRCIICTYKWSLGFNLALIESCWIKTPIQQDSIKTVAFATNHNCKYPM